MKLLIPAIILFSLISPSVKAQSFPDNSLPEQFLVRTAYGRNNLKANEIQGSPYLNKEYNVGTVLIEGDVLYKDIPLRYNCFTDVLEFSKNDVAYDLSPKSVVKRAEFGGQVFTYKDYESNKGIAKSYFRILLEGKALLCIRYSIQFYEKELVKGYADAKPARFDDFEKSYYVAIGNSPAKKLANNKKLVEILADKHKEIESFMSKQKLSIKKEEDLKKIISYYNSL